MEELLSPNEEMLNALESTNDYYAEPVSYTHLTLPTN